MRLLCSLHKPIESYVSDGSVIIARRALNNELEPLDEWEEREEEDGDEDEMGGVEQGPIEEEEEGDPYPAASSSSLAQVANTDVSEPPPPPAQLLEPSTGTRPSIREQMAYGIYIPPALPGPCRLDSRPSPGATHLSAATALNS